MRNVPQPPGGDRRAWAGYAARPRSLPGALSATVQSDRHGWATEPAHPCSRPVGLAHASACAPPGVLLPALLPPLSGKARGKAANVRRISNCADPSRRRGQCCVGVAQARRWRTASPVRATRLEKSPMPPGVEGHQARRCRGGRHLRRAGLAPGTEARRVSRQGDGWQDEPAQVCGTASTRLGRCWCARHDRWRDGDTARRRDRPAVPTMPRVRYPCLSGRRLHAGPVRGTPCSAMSSRRGPWARPGDVSRR